jgi:hypothetical protein
MNIAFSDAGMVELADALASGASARKSVQVQVLFPAPEKIELRVYPGVRFFANSHL